MTVEFIDAVYRLPDLTATEVNVLVYLANAANRDGECWLKRSTIGKATRLHPDTVKTALTGLADRGLISKKPMTNAGRIVATAIVLLFDPVRPIPEARGRYAPIDRGPRPPTTGSGLGGSSAPGHGGSATPDKKSRSKEPDNPLKAPKGAVPASVVTFAEQVWAEAPKIARQRSGMADLTRALNAAITDRGGDPAAILAGLRAYWQEDGARDGGQHLRGLHRMIQQDRWREWTPDAGDDGDDAPGASPAPPAPVVDAAYIERVWRDRLAEFRRIGIWKHATYGPPPGKIGCQVPAHLLASGGDEAQQ